MVLAFCTLRLSMLLAMLYNTRFVRVRSLPVVGRGNDGEKAGSRRSWDREDRIDVLERPSTCYAL